MTAKLIKKIFAPMLVLILALSITAPLSLINIAFAAEAGESEYAGESEEYTEEYETPATPCVYDQLFAAKTVEEFFVIMCQTEENKPQVFGFNPEQLAELKAHAETLPCEDEEIKAELTDTFLLLEAGELGDVATYADTTYNSDQTWGTQTISNKVFISGTVTITVKANSTVTLMGEINVPQGASLTIKCAGSATLKVGDADNANGNDIFDVIGTLTMSTTNGGKITVEGDNLARAYDGVGFRVGYKGVTDTELNLTNVIIKNINNSQNSAAAAILTRGDKAGISKMTISLTDCEIDNCIAKDGSALYLRQYTASIVDLTRVKITNCVALGADYKDAKEKGGCGGTIRTNGSTGARLELNQCLFYNNWSGYKAAGKDQVRIYNSENSNENGGTCYGAAVYWNAYAADANGDLSKAYVYDCIFIENYANKAGGAIFNEAAMDIGTDSQNTSTGSVLDLIDKESNTINVSAIDLSNIKGTLFFKNEAGGYIFDGEAAPGTGGAISVPSYKGGSAASLDQNVELTIGKGVYVINNTADEGGGFGMSITQTDDKKDGDSFNVTIDGAVFENNIAKKYGGGIYVEMTHSGYNSSLNLVSGTLSGNTAPKGGAVYVHNVNVVIGNETQGPKIFSNSATDGGAIYLNNGAFSTHEVDADNNPIVKAPWQTVVIDNGEIYSNTAASDGTTETQYGIGGAVYVKGGSATINGGDIHDNTATFGGAISVDGGNIEMNGGKIYSCTASQYGGGALVSEGIFTMNGGEIYGCNAYSGGALSVSSKDTSGSNPGYFIMKAGTISKNTASHDGGAVYVYLGHVEMYDGTFSENTAARYGGAVCVQVGQMYIFHGLLEKNVAEYGGAVCVDRGDFYMYSGTMRSNGKWNLEDPDKNVTQAGGGAYITEGDAYIGIENCQIENPDDKHAKGQTTHHPIIAYNAAQFGGGIATHGDINDQNAGNLYLYCSEIDYNYTGDDGKGRNAFADGGNIYHYVKGTYIGDLRVEDGVQDVYDPGIVVIGGNVHAPDDNEKKEITIIYHSGINNAAGEEIVWNAKVVEGFIMNLPYCPEEWEKDEYVFVGWTSAQKTGAVDVRETKHYRWVGDRFEIKIPEDGQSINLFALWAPVTNNIDYSVSLDGDIQKATDAFENHEAFKLQKTYRLQSAAGTITLGVPYKYGYTFVEWRFYAKAETASNWGMDPKDPDKNGYVSFTVEDLQQISGENGTYTLNTMTNFGDLMMVAVFKSNETKIEYVIVGREEGGTLSASSESINVVNGNPYGSNATTKSGGYKIIGWYSDEACTVPADHAWITGTEYVSGDNGYIRAIKIDPKLNDGQIWNDPNGDPSKDPDFGNPDILPTTYYVKVVYSLDATDKVEAGEKYDGVDGTETTVTVLKDRYFTVQYDFYLPYSDVSFVSDKAFPAGTKLILLDNVTWTAYYCEFGAAKNSVSISEFIAMNGNTHPSANASKFVLCVDLSGATADAGEYVIHLDDNNTNNTVGKVTVKLLGFANVGVTTEDGEDGFTATVTVDGIETTDSGNTMHSLVIELFDESGKELDYPAGSSISIAGKAVKIHDNRAIIDGIADGTYSIAFDRLPGGTYKLKAYLSQETAQAYPVREEVASADASATVTSSKQTVYARTSDNRFLVAGVGGTLTFETDAESIELQTKNANGDYVSGAVGIGISGKTVTVGADAAAGTYRIVFKKGDAIVNYNIIVYND